VHVRFGERASETISRKTDRRAFPTLPYFKVVGWGWYYLSTVLDDYSRYIISFKLFTSMSSGDVKETLDAAIAKTGITGIKVKYKPRLLSDNGPCYISGELKHYLQKHSITHVRGAPWGG
jgi:transposase InsO family protein